jgi:hypothetical protein
MAGKKDPRDDRPNPKHLVLEGKCRSSRGCTFGTNRMPTIRTGFKSAAATVWFAAEPDLIKDGAGSSKLAAPTAAKPIVKPTVITIRRVWFMRGHRQPVIFVPVVTATGQVHAGGFGFT